MDDVAFSALFKTLLLVLSKFFRDILNEDSFLKEKYRYLHQKLKIYKGKVSNSFLFEILGDFHPNTNCSI